jgi:hypothetical protein
VTAGRTAQIYGTSLPVIYPHSLCWFFLGTRVMDFIHVTIHLLFETVNSREVIEMVTGFFHIE